VSSPAVFGSSDLATPYVAGFSHASESAHPGNYQVELNPGSPSAVNVELTAAGTRTSLGRFTFPSTRSASVLINAGGSAMADYDASVSIDPEHALVTGTASSGEFCYQPSRYRLYFAAEFNRPFTAFGTWKRQLVQPGSRSSDDVTSIPSPILIGNYKTIPGGPPSLPGDPSGTAQAGAYLTFDASTDRVVQMRVAVSSVSAQNAIANLHSEGSSWDFNAARSRMSARWDRALSRVQVSGGSAGDLRTFYTALYHTMIEPQTFSDANGQYMGMDGSVHTAVGYTQYANFSEWDIYRTEIPLTAMLDPGLAGDEVQSLLADQRQSGWLPKWGFLNQQTDLMAGDSADPIIAGAYAFGARNFDVHQALAAMSTVRRRPDPAPTTGTSNARRSRTTSGCTMSPRSSTTAADRARLPT
jgi:predicted alpha-1,2-mannosidase